MDVRATGGLIGGLGDAATLSPSLFTYDRLGDYSTCYIALLDRMQVR